MVPLPNAAPPAVACTRAVLPCGRGTRETQLKEGAMPADTAPGHGPFPGNNDVLLHEIDTRLQRLQAASASREEQRELWALLRDILAVLRLLRDPRRFT